MFALFVTVHNKLRYFVSPVFKVQNNSVQHQCVRKSVAVISALPTKADVSQGEQNVCFAATK